jgi:hypothetical protein
VGPKPCGGPPRRHPQRWDPPSPQHLSAYLGCWVEPGRAWTSSTTSATTKSINSNQALAGFVNLPVGFVCPPPTSVGRGRRRHGGRSIETTCRYVSRSTNPELLYPSGNSEVRPFGKRPPKHCHGNHQLRNSTEFGRPCGSLLQEPN